MEAKKADKMNSGDEIERALIFIKVKTLDGHTYTVKVPKDITVPLLKECIAAEAHVPPELQRLIFRGKVVKDDQLLSDHKVEDGHTLHLVPRLAPSQEPTTVPQTGPAPSPGGVQHTAQIPGVSFQTYTVPGDGMPDLNRIVAGVLQSMNIGLSAGPANLVQVVSGDPAPAGGGTSVEVRIDAIQGHPFQIQQRMSVQGQPQQQPQAQPHQHPPAQPLLDSLATIHQYLDRYELALTAEQAANGAEAEAASASAHPEASSVPEALGTGPGLQQADVAAPTPVGSSDNGGGSGSQSGTPGRGTHGGPLGGADLLRAVRRVQNVMNDGVASFFEALVSDLEGESGLESLESRRRLHAAFIQRGNLMQQLGALLLELGRTTMGTRLGTRVGEVLVPNVHPLFISPHGPSPLVVQSRTPSSGGPTRRPPQPPAPRPPAGPTPPNQPPNPTATGPPPPEGTQTTTATPTPTPLVANMVVDVDDHGNVQIVGTPMVGILPNWPPQGFGGVQAFQLNPQRPGGQEVPVGPTAGTGGAAGGAPPGATAAPQGANPLAGMFGQPPWPPARGVGHFMGVPSVTHITMGGAPSFGMGMGMGMGMQAGPGVGGGGQQQDQQQVQQLPPGFVTMGMPPVDIGALFGNIMQGLVIPPPGTPVAPQPSELGATGVPGPPPSASPSGTELPVDRLDVNQLLAPLMRQLAGALHRSQPQAPTAPPTVPGMQAAHTPTPSQPQGPQEAPPPPPPPLPSATSAALPPSLSTPTATVPEGSGAPGSAPAAVALAASGVFPGGNSEVQSGSGVVPLVVQSGGPLGGPGGSHPSGSAPLGLGMGGLQPLPRTRRRSVGPRSQAPPVQQPPNPPMTMEDIMAQLQGGLGGGQLGGGQSTRDSLGAVLRGENAGGVGGVMTQMANYPHLAAMVERMEGGMGGEAPVLDRGREGVGAQMGRGGVDFSQMLTQMMPVVANMLGGGQGGVGGVPEVGEEPNWQNHLSQEELAAWTAQMGADEAHQAAMRLQRAPSDVITGGSTAKRQRTALTETAERLQEGVPPQAVFRGVAEAAGRSMAEGGAGLGMTPDAAARLVNHLVETPGLAEAYVGVVGHDIRLSLAADPDVLLPQAQGRTQGGSPS